MRLRTPRQPDTECAFCGSDTHLQMDEQLTFSLLLKPHHRVCTQCHQSRDGRAPSTWFAWLKRNDPQHWQRIVDHHRLTVQPFSAQVLQVRAEL